MLLLVVNTTAYAYSTDSVQNNELSLFLCSNDEIIVNYTENQEKDAKRVIKYLELIPSEMKKGTKSIYLLDYPNGNVAGTATDEEIFLYEIESYDYDTQKHIICHEIAHNWKNYIIRYKLVDYELTAYSEAVILDNNYISDYSKVSIIEKGNYSEDFADSVSMFVNDSNKLQRKYPNRYNYINNLLFEHKKEELKEKFKKYQDRVECLVFFVRRLLLNGKVWWKRKNG